MRVQITMWFLILFAVVGVVMLVLAWTAASPSKERRGDSSLPYSGDTSSSEHVHSDHCGHGHNDGGGDTGGTDSGGGDGGGDSGGDGGGGSD